MTGTHAKETVIVNGPVEEPSPVETPAEPVDAVADELTTENQQPSLEAEAGDEAGELDAPENDDGSVLAKLRQLIRQRTRFDESDVQAVAESCAAQALHIEVTHTLDTEFKSRDITGRTAPSGSGAQVSPNPYAAASAEAAACLARGMDVLDKRLRDSSLAYNGLRDGLWLGSTIYYELHSCSPCHGRGRISCHTCAGRCTETCYQCSGVGRSNCTWCFGSGKTTCTRCHGTNQVSEGYTEYYTEQVWVNDRYESVSRSRWATRYVPCNCQYGKVNCGHCFGLGKVNCSTCSAVGTITCRTCSGIGNLRCDPCDASGRVGTSAWTEVRHQATYSMGWLEPLDARAEEISAGVDLHRIAKESRVLDRIDVQRLAESPSGRMRAAYRGELDIRHLDADCGGDSYHVVAYGVNRTWLDLDKIINDLLDGDLEALRSALVSADTNKGSRRLEGITEPLRHVVESELNTTAVDAILNGGSLDELHTMVSPEYAQRLKHALLSALKRTYNYVAARTWWQAPLFCGALVATAWRLNYPYLALIPAAGAIPLSLLHIRHKAKRVFAATLGSAEKARKALEHVRKAGQHRLAHGLLMLPSLAVIALAVTGVLHPYAREIKSPAVAAPTLQLVTDPTLAQALTLYRQANFAAAKPLLQKLADQGNTQAYRPLADVLWQQSRKAAGTAAATDKQAATNWALKAVAATPEDADALLLAGQLLTVAGQSKSNVAKGTTLLKQAAAKGSDEAMHDLGLMYVLGAQIAKDPAQARHWFTEAANAGRAGDMYNLGLMDWKGEGLPAPNKESARQWWKKAAAKGDARAVQVLARGGPGG